MVGTTSKGGTSAFKGIEKKGCTPVHTCPPTQKKTIGGKKKLTFGRKLLLPAIFGVHVGIQGCKWIPQSLHILRPYDSWSEALKQLVLYVNINITRDNHIPTSSDKHIPTPDFSIWRIDTWGCQKSQPPKRTNGVLLCFFENLRGYLYIFGVSKNRGTPRWLVYNGNRIKMDD